jgi:hypothetical protein
MHQDGVLDHVPNPNAPAHPPPTLTLPRKGGGDTAAGAYSA